MENKYPSYRTNVQTNLPTPPQAIAPLGKSPSKYDDWSVTQASQDSCNPDSEGNLLAQLIKTESQYIKELERLSSLWSTFNPSELYVLLANLEAICNASKEFVQNLNIELTPSSTRELEDTLILLADKLLPIYIEYFEGFISNMGILSSIRNSQSQSRYPIDSSSLQQSQEDKLEYLFNIPYERLVYYKKLYEVLLGSYNPDTSEYQELLYASQRVETVIQLAEQIRISSVDDNKSSMQYNNGYNAQSLVEEYATDDCQQRISPTLPDDVDLHTPLETFQESIDCTYVRDLFTLQPKRCKLQLSPPNMPNQRFIVERGNVFISLLDKRDNVTGSCVTHPSGHVVLLSDLFLICNRMTEEEMRRKPGKRLYLLYPPLMVRYLHFALVDSNEEDSLFEVVIKKRERILMRAPNKQARDLWLKIASERGLTLGVDGLTAIERKMPQKDLPRPGETILHTNKPSSSQHPSEPMPIELSQQLNSPSSDPEAATQSQVSGLAAKRGYAPLLMNPSHASSHLEKHATSPKSVAISPSLAPQSSPSQNSQHMLSPLPSPSSSPMLSPLHSPIFTTSPGLQSSPHLGPAGSNDFLRPVSSDRHQLRTDRTISTWSTLSNSAVRDVILRTGTCDVFQRKGNEWRVLQEDCAVEVRVATSDRKCVSILLEERNQLVLNAWIKTGLIIARESATDLVLRCEVGGRKEAYRLVFDVPYDVDALESMLQRFLAEQAPSMDPAHLLSRFASLATEEEVVEQTLQLENRVKGKVYLQNEYASWIYLGSVVLLLSIQKPSNKAHVRIDLERKKTCLLNALILPEWVERLANKRLTIMVQNDRGLSTVYAVQFKDEATTNIVFDHIKNQG
ncbi:uncharacterized protein VTP21DRAFT_9163 [Calcarisporiella thermophila]|uniref:uncharacterized protein n=1 Tax=Calcarisporiella thermophila TaxID=911321 RepID=UPI0037446DF0